MALKNGKLKGILWHQGESDATLERAPKWGAKFESMIKSFRRELGDVPFIAGELGGLILKELTDVEVAYIVPTTP